ncbi:MAG: PilZ domain-containing protein [Phycisphaeraceae bacterium]
MPEAHAVGGRTDQRQHPRIKVPALYTLVRARVLGSEKYTFTGHIYDVSVGGMRMGLDMPVETNTRLEVRGMLPGGGHTTFRAIGRVARIHSDANDRGPVILGVQFESFRSPMDRHRLSQYIAARSRAQATALRRAA